MLVEQVFKVYLNNTTFSLDPAGEGVEITDGILSVDIVHGFDKFEGPWQQIDAGQFTIITRNPNLDPSVNPDIKYNSMISFIDTRSNYYNNEFFRGYITDINVEYQRDDNPIITITGTDIFGILSRHVITQATYDAIVANSTGVDWHGLYFHELIDYLNDFSDAYLYQDVFIGGQPLRNGFVFDSFKYPNMYNAFLPSVEPHLLMGYSPAKYIPQVGETYLDIFNKYVQTNLTSFSYDYLGDLDYIYFTIYPFFKYRPAHWQPENDPRTKYEYLFSSDPADNKPYESIVIDNGYNSIYNQLNISNEYRYIEDGELKSVTDNKIYQSDTSIQDYKNSQISVSTIFTPNAVTPGNGAPIPLNSQFTIYQRDVLQITSTPSYEVKEVTVDNAKYEDIQNNFTYTRRLYETFRIKHNVSENVVIDKIYDIVGIKHSITPDKWTTTYITKKSDEQFVYEYQGEHPTLELNALSGDANFNFTATITGVDPTRINQVIWGLNSTLPDTDQYAVPLIYPTVTTGERYKDGLNRTGFTQTWNFDDDGILNPQNTYAGPPPIPNPPLNFFGNYGPGNYVVWAFIQLTNRYWIYLTQPIVVGTPEVHADFVYVQNQVNNFGQVAFTNTSLNHETNEPDSYLWDFGDGTTSTEQNPIHVYNPSNPSQTTYDVSLTVFAYGPGNTKVYDTITQTITLVQPTITADFSWTVNNQTVSFVNLSTNIGVEEPDAWYWEFSDGTTSTLKEPVKTFPLVGGGTTTYTAKLTARDIWERTAVSDTKSFTLTGPNSSGNFDVRYIKLRIEPDTLRSNTNRTVTPVMSYLKATTSDTNANLIYLKPIQDLIINSYSSNFTWRSANNGFNGGLPLTAQNPPLYLTKNPSGLPLTDYGLGVFRRSTTPSQSTYWELVIDIGENTNTIKNLSMNLKDLLDSNFADYGLCISSYYPRIWVDVATTLGNFTQLPNGTMGTPIRNGDWLTIGYFDPPQGRMDPTKPANTRTEINKTMVPIRPMPPMIPYFTYTVSNTYEKTINFDSIETADSYLWTFGDSTTSTLKNPTKTYTNYGTYNVTLQVTNGGVITRTTTEQVIVEKRLVYPQAFRYVKFVQNNYTGAHAWDSPNITGFSAEYHTERIYNNSNYVVGTMTNTTTAFSQEFYAVDKSGGSFNPDTGSLNNRQLMCRTDYIYGMRVKSLDASYQFGWSTIIDFGTTINKATNFIVGFNKRLGDMYDSSTLPVLNGISFTVYVTDYVGTTLDPNAVTWTQVGTITPTGIPLQENKYYKLDGLTL